MGTQSLVSLSSSSPTPLKALDGYKNVLLHRYDLKEDHGPREFAPW
jgi:hypothetical protein